MAMGRDPGTSSPWPFIKHLAGRDAGLFGSFPPMLSVVEMRADGHGQIIRNAGLSIGGRQGELPVLALRYQPLHPHLAGGTE